MLALARTKINQFRFMGQENLGTRIPDLGWIGNGLLFLQIHISEEIYGLAIIFKVGTDRSLSPSQASVAKAERMVDAFINSLNEILKDFSKGVYFLDQIKLVTPASL